MSIEMILGIALLVVGLALIAALGDLVAAGLNRRKAAVVDKLIKHGKEANE